MNIIQGDLIKLAQDGMFDMIVHGCNCDCVMGAGVAKQIREAFPRAYEVDKMTKGTPRDLKIGTISCAYHGDLTIVNAYTQYGFGRGMQVNYAAIRSVFCGISQRFPNKRIAYPKIGAGLGGGDWETIRQIIDLELYGMNHTLVEYA